MNDLGMPASHQGERLLWVQVLRGVAALLVLAGHAQGVLLDAAARQGQALQRLPLPPGGFGVDLFFCISGLIMVVASRPLYGQPGAAGAFLRRRALRLVPLYWLATGLSVLALLVGRHGLERTSWNDLLASLLFLPYPVYGDAAQPFPLLTLGWSLNYEVFFYALFAVFIALPTRRAVACTVAALAAIVLAGSLVTPHTMALHFWSRPILLEFGLGCLLGLWWLRGAPAASAAVLGFGSAALVALALDPFGLSIKPAGGSTPNDLVRVIGWGLPAAALLAAALWLERHGVTLSLGRVGQALARLGDWSYSLYLMHPFALLATVKAWERLALHQQLPWWMLGALLPLGSLLLAALSYRFIEQPLLRRLRPAPLVRRVEARA
ncbi:acyltransferase family protein [Azohydromonas caseinilytica]|uniref:Acyltransferase n=1 Tax=Azohydromonas caseinilytica TaxID=2728836 RepID=A0A848FG05_9BURK|nr:acyltransferase [Azohydromonas caseinilytica]NML17775.1 acyltransferase [Azohydromonas caseinilytica]